MDTHPDVLSDEYIVVSVVVDIPANKFRSLEEEFRRDLAALLGCDVEEVIVLDVKSRS